MVFIMLRSATRVLRPTSLYSPLLRHHMFNPMRNLSHSIDFKKNYESEIKQIYDFLQQGPSVDSRRDISRATIEDKHSSYSRIIQKERDEYKKIQPIRMF